MLVIVGSEKRSAMKTVLYYFSATGNSLYVARFLQTLLPGAELCSIPEALANGITEPDADCVGVVFPMHYFGLPVPVENFFARVALPSSAYVFAIATCGIPYWGRPFLDANVILETQKRRLDASWYVRLVSNYLPLRDTAADWRIRIRAWLAEKKLRKIARMVADKESHSTWQIMTEFCKKHHAAWRERQMHVDEQMICDTEKCISCGLCERVCPVRNIERPNGHPVWQHRCVECLGCLHICPKEAIDFGAETKGRRRYRHKEIAAKDLLHRFES